MTEQRRIFRKGKLSVLIGMISKQDLPWMIVTRFAMRGIILSCSLYLSHTVSYQYQNQPTNPPPSLQDLQYPHELE